MSDTIHPIPSLVARKPTEFSIHLAAYLTAVRAYETHCAAQEPPSVDDPLWFAYENSYGALVSAMHEAGVEAIKTPAVSGEEVVAKLTIFRAQDYRAAEPEVIKVLLDAMIADGVRIGGAA